MLVSTGEMLNPLFLLRGEITLVALNEDEEGLVPERGELPVVVGEVHEVLVDCVNHLCPRVRT